MPQSKYQLRKPQPAEEAPVALRPAEPSSDPSAHPLPGTPAFNTRPVIAAGIRGTSGLLSAEGGIPGALISGGGELASEAVGGELFNQSPLRSLAKVLGAGAVGAIPAAAGIKAGKTLTSVLRGGALAGGGEAVRELTGGEGLNPKSVATSAAIGGATSGAFSKLLGLLAPEAAAAPRWANKEEYFAEKASKMPKEPPTWSGYTGKGAPYYPEQESYAIPGTESGRVQKVMAKEAAVANKAKAEQEARDVIEAQIAEHGYTPGEPIISETVQPGGKTKLSSKTPYEPPAKDDGSWTEDDLGNIISTGKSRKAPARPKEAPPAGTPAGDIYDGWRARGRDHATALKLSIKGLAPQAPLEASAAAGKVEVSPQAAQDIANYPAAAAAPPVEAPAQLESPLGKLLKQKKERPGKVQKFNQGVEDILSKTEAAPQSAPAAEAAVVPEAVTPDVPAPAAPPTDLAELFRTHLEGAGGHTGKAYRLIQEAAARGEASPELVAHAREQQMAYLAAQKAAKEAAANPVVEPLEAPPGARSVTLPETGVMNPSGTGNKRAMNFLDQLKASAEAQPPAPPVPETAAPQADWVAEAMKEVERLKGERGAISPGLLRLLSGVSGAAVGAPIGASMSDEENKGKGALAGAALGGALGAGGVALGQYGLRNAITDIPKWQRFSLLTSSPNSALANIFAGPWGSGVVKGLESGMSGDPRGWSLLKNMFNAKQLGKDFIESLKPAASAIGRAEGDIETNPSLPHEIMSLPGTAMTAGDMSSRNAITRAGFSEPEARTATLTSEPELFLFKKLADMFKGSARNPNDLTKVAAEMAFPFKRTPANIAEQGSFRFPGLGFLMQGMRENPDPVRQQIVQQLMNAGIGAGSYMLSSNLDPESAKIARKYVSNLAGPHSMMASAGFAAGQARRAGNPVLSGKTYQEFANTLPLPTHQALQDWIKFAGDLPQGKLSIPQGMVPLRGLDPSILSGVVSVGNEELTSPAPTSRYRLIKP